MSDSIYKKLVNALFKLSGSQAMPSASSITIISSDNTDEVTYVAPADGYVSLMTKYVTENGTIQLYDETVDFAFQTYKKDASTRMKFYIPVRKGDTIKKQGALTVDKMIFNYLVGGGD